jgi:hypothetical protein
LLMLPLGCSEYVEDFHYAPHPARAEIFPGPMQAPPPPATQPQNPLKSIPSTGQAEIQPPNPQYPPPPQGAPQEPPLISTFATVVGVHRENKQAGIPTSVELRIRVVNHAAHSAVFEPQSLELVDGEMLRFSPPILRPSEPVNLAPMQAAVIHAWFPFPPGNTYENTDLSSLQVHWVIVVDGRDVEQMANFHRIHLAHYYYDPYWDYPGYYPYPWFGGTVVFRHRW